jgi:hypothetical protein
MKSNDSATVKTVQRLDISGSVTVNVAQNVGLISELMTAKNGDK